jgi:WD40 repeat protein
VQPNPVRRCVYRVCLVSSLLAICPRSTSGDDVPAARKPVPVRSLSFSPDSRLLAASTADRLTGDGLTPFDTGTLERQSQLDWRIGSTRWSAYSPEQRWIALATQHPTVYVFPTERSPDPLTQQTVAELLAKLRDDDRGVRQRATDELAGIAPAARPQLLEALNSPDPEVRWRSREILRRMSLPDSAVQLAAHRAGLETVCFSPDGRLMASGDRTGRVIVWNVAIWQPVASLTVPEEVDQ